MALGCFYSPISTRTFRRALTTSVDSCVKTVPHQWHNQIWQSLEEGARKRCSEYGYTFERSAAGFMFNITPDSSIPNTDLDSVLLLYHGTHLKEALLHVGLEWHQILWRSLFVDDEAVSQQGYLGDNGRHSTVVTDLIKLRSKCISQNWKCVAQHSLRPQLCLTLSLKTFKWNPWCTTQLKPSALLNPFSKDV